MSVIACQVKDGKISLASDSLIAVGSTNIGSGTFKYAKLTEQNGIICGAVGTVEESAMFQLFCSTHAPEHSDTPGILSFMGEFSDWKKKKTDDCKLENDYILVVNGRCFDIRRWCITEVDKYDAIGAGQDFAMTALHLGHTAKEAVEITCKLCVYCSLPVIEFFADTKLR